MKPSLSNSMQISYIINCLKLCSASTEPKTFLMQSHLKCYTLHYSIRILSTASEPYLQCQSQMLPKLKKFKTKPSELLALPNIEIQSTPCTMNLISSLTTSSRNRLNSTLCTQLNTNMLLNHSLIHGKKILKETLPINSETMTCFTPPY